MDSPLYQAPYVGNGMVIGANAIVHVFISHGIAIGAFAMLALADYAVAGTPPARRRKAGTGFCAAF